MSWQSIKKKWKRKIKLLQRRKPHKENTKRKKKLGINIVRDMDKGLRALSFYNHKV